MTRDQRATPASAATPAAPPRSQPGSSNTWRSSCRMHALWSRYAEEREGGGELPLLTTEDPAGTGRCDARRRLLGQREIVAEDVPDP
jgi:hypothetical protein